MRQVLILSASLTTASFAAFVQAEDAAQSAPARAPQLLYAAWQEDGIRSTGQPIPHTLWDKEGKVIPASQADLLLKAVGSFDVAWRREGELRPLVLMFAVDRQLTYCPVRPTIIDSDNQKHPGMTARSKPKNGVTVSAAVPRTRTLKAWPKQVSLEINYPIENWSVTKVLAEVPDDPLKIAPGIQWYLDPQRARVVDREAGALKQADGTAAVLQISREHADPLVLYKVNVYLRGQDKRVREAYATIIEPDGELHEIRVSEAIAGKVAIERVEIMRQRYEVSRIDNVPVRIDLLDKGNDKVERQ